MKLERTALETTIGRLTASVDVLRLAKLQRAIEGALDATGSGKKRDRTDRSTLPAEKRLVGSEFEREPSDPKTAQSSNA